MLRPARWLGPLVVRLAAAFVAVALTGLAVLAIAVLLVDRRDVNRLAAAHRLEISRAISTALQQSFETNQGWVGADLQSAVALSGSAGVGLALDDRAGAAVLRAGPQGLLTQPSSTVVAKTFSVGSQPVGRLRLAFASGGLTASERHLKATLVDALGWSAALAAGVALVVAVVVARAVVRPIKRLSEAAAALEARKAAPGWPERRAGRAGGFGPRF